MNLSTTLCPRSYPCRVIFRFRYRKTAATTQSLIEFQKSVLITEHFQTLKNSFYEYSITYVIVSNSTKFLSVSLNITTRSRMLDIWVLHLRGVSSTNLKWTAHFFVFCFTFTFCTNIRNISIRQDTWKCHLVNLLHCWLYTYRK